MISSAINEDYVYYVYWLRDEASSLPFYIGKGKGDRMHKHTRYIDKNSDGNSYKVNTIKKILSEGRKILAEAIAENLDEGTAYKIEEMYIKFFGRKHIEKFGILVNITPNSRPPKFEDHPNKEQWCYNISEGDKRAYAEGRKILTEENKIKLQESNNKRKGKPNLNRRGYVAWNKGQTKADNVIIAEISSKNTGKKRTEESLENMRIGQQEAQNDSELRQKKSEWMKGKKNGLGHGVPEESRKIIGDNTRKSLKGRKRDPEAVKKSIETRMKNRILKEQLTTEVEHD
jgi:hypothetical protein